MEPADVVRVDEESSNNAFAPAPGPPPGRERGAGYRPRPVNSHVAYQQNTRRAVIMRADVGDYLIEVTPDTREEVEWERADGAVAVRSTEDPDFNEMNLYLSYARKKNSKPLVINITTMTEYELLCLRDAFIAVVDLALPIARELDERAKNRDNSDGFTNRRLYRGVPAIHTNQAPARVYVEGLYDESAGPPVLAWPAGIGPRRARSADDGVAEQRGVGGEEPGDGEAMEE